MARPAHVVDVRSRVAEVKRDKWEDLQANTSKGSLTWEDVGSEDLKDALVAVTEDGAALLLSKTSDGGALVLQVWNASGRHKLYPASMAELNEALQAIKEIALS